MMPLWVPIALVCALSLAASDAALKRAMQEGAGELFCGWARVVLGALPLIAIVAFLERPEIRPGFYVAIAVGIPFEVLATFLYTRAIRVSPLSLTLPFLAFTPVFVIATGFVFAGEKVSLQGAGGIALIAAGSYVLNLHHQESGLMGPFRAIRKEKGSIMMLLVSIIYALTATMIKVGIVNSSPLFYGAVYFAVFSVAYAPLGLRGARAVSPKGAWLILLAGAFMLVMFVTHMVSVSMTEVAYMMSIKRTSLLFGVMLGYLLFHEGHIKERLAGASLMLAGFVLVVLSA